MGTEKMSENEELLFTNRPGPQISSSVNTCTTNEWIQGSTSGQTLKPQPADNLSWLEFFSERYPISPEQSEIEPEIIDSTLCLAITQE